MNQLGDEQWRSTMCNGNAKADEKPGSDKHPDVD